MPRKQQRTDGTALVELDPWLEPYADRLRERYAYYRAALAKIDDGGGLIGQISQGHHYFGFNRGERDGAPGVWYREWAPAARQLFLTGDFNGWDRNSHPLARDEWGAWSLFLPDAEYASRLVHGSRVKVHVVGGDGSALDRIPAYARRVVQEPPMIGEFVAQFWMPPDPYRWEHPAPALLPPGEGLRIYETHVGMAQEEGRVGAFD